jgi:protein-S-isoprenylcysteine O-methyltransferase Ste14
MVSKNSEEAYLERKFRDVYRRYCTRVRRWL